VNDNNATFEWPDGEIQVWDDMSAADYAVILVTDSELRTPGWADTLWYNAHTELWPLKAADALNYAEEKLYEIEDYADEPFPINDPDLLVQYRDKLREVCGDCINIRIERYIEAAVSSHVAAQELQIATDALTDRERASVVGEVSARIMQADIITTDEVSPVDWDKLTTTEAKD